LRTASHPQRPDVAIEVTDDSGATGVILFDPKYKLESEALNGDITDARPKKEDMDKMHAYRDAVRDARDERVVRLAAILYPGPTVAPFGAGVDAISAVPGSSDLLDQRLEDILRRELSSRFGVAAAA
jgi:predicted component of viral defense system (DUF524 family)